MTTTQTSEKLRDQAFAILKDQGIDPFEADWETWTGAVAQARAEGADA